MHIGPGHYPHNGSPPNTRPQPDEFRASPPKPPSANSLLDRLSEPTAARPTRAPGHTHSPSPRSAAAGPTPTETPTSAPAPERQGQPGAGGPSLPSEATVDAFLESVLQTEVAASLHAPPSEPPSALLASTRALLLPQLLANARARRPGARVDEAAAAALLTDEWCKEMIALARRAREEMRRRVAETEAARGVRVGAGARDAREGAGVPGQSGVRGDAGREDVRMDDVERPPGRPQEYPASVEGVEKTTAPGPAMAQDGGREDVRTDLVEFQAKQSEEQRSEDVRMDVSEDRAEPPLPQDARMDGVDGHGAIAAQPVETMLGTAARVLQDFIAKTPRPRSEALPEANAGQPPASESAPSSMQSPTSLENAQSQAVEEAHTPTTQRAGAGLWAMQVGSNVPRITTVTFDVPETVAAAVQRWARRHSAYDADATHIAVHLLCLPVRAVAEASSSMHVLRDPGAMSDAFWNIQTQWPPKGGLIVEVNGGDALYAHTFFPAQLGATDGPLELTSHVRAGTNTLRLIQLRDTSEWVYAVHAGAPPPMDVAPGAAAAAAGDGAREWEAFVARASARHGAIVATPMAVAPV